MTKKAVGYVRVSTIRQAEEGYSLEAQETKIRDWCAFKGYELVKIEWDEGLSARDMKKRDGLKRALDALDDGMALVCYKLDRITRSTKDLIYITELLHKKKANIVSLTQDIDTTTSMGKFFFTLMGALAELESNLISERVSMGMRAKQAKGGYIGGYAPIGYHLADNNNEKILEPNQNEQSLVEIAKRLRSNGFTLSEVSVLLAEEGYLSRVGKPFHAYQLSRMLGEAR